VKLRFGHLLTWWKQLNSSVIVVDPEVTHIIEHEKESTTQKGSHLQQKTCFLALVCGSAHACNCNLCLFS